MNHEVMDEKTRKMHEALQRAVTDTLERKRRLGHYAVLWKDGKVVLEGDDAPQLTTEAETQEQSVKPQ